MLRINQYRPNLRNNSGKVKERQFSEKATPEGADIALSQMTYVARMLNEEITEVTISYDEGKITGIHITCSNPQYEWDRGYHSFLVYYRPRKHNWEQTYEERAEEAEKHLINFLKEAEKYFKENDLNPRINKLEGYELTDITIEELTSSINTSIETAEEAPEAPATNDEAPATAEATETNEETIEPIRTDKDYIFAIFGVTFSIEERDQCLRTVKHLDQYKSAKTKDLNQLKKYVKDLKHWQEETADFYLEFGGADPAVIDNIKTWIAKELEVVDTPHLQYTSSYVSLLILNWKVDSCFNQYYDTNNAFYACLELCEYLNSFYDIAEPYKAPNKIAYGWKFAIEKDSKPYFYACLKNYLTKNNAEFTTEELRKIIGFLSCENGDE